MKFSNSTWEKIASMQRKHKARDGRSMSMVKLAGQSLYRSIGAEESPGSTEQDAG
jgi:hypothetical protein